LYKNGLTCKDIVEATNRVQIVVKLFNVMTDIWTASNCDSKSLMILLFSLIISFYFDCFLFFKKACFERITFENNTANYTIKKEIKEFGDMEKLFQDCIFNFTQVNFSH
jgi:hypothetical protein